MCLCVYSRIYIYIYIHTHVERKRERFKIIITITCIIVIHSYTCIYIYICIERERDRDRPPPLAHRLRHRGHLALGRRERIPHELSKSTHSIPQDLYNPCLSLIDYARTMFTPTMFSRRRPWPPRAPSLRPGGWPQYAQSPY